MEILYEQGGEFRVVFVDATIQEDHSHSAMVTEHVVEEGISLADHVRPERGRLSVEAVVTNTPILSPNVDGAEGVVTGVEFALPRKSYTKGAENPDGNAQPSETETTSVQVKGAVLRFDDEFDRVGAVHAKLLELQSTGTPVTVVTTLRTYDQMAITAIGAPRSADSGNAVRFRIEFVELRFAESETVEAPEPLETRAERQRRRGRQSAEPEENAEGEEDGPTRSTLDRLTDDGLDATLDHLFGS